MGSTRKKKEKPGIFHTFSAKFGLLCIIYIMNIKKRQISDKNEENFGFLSHPKPILNIRTLVRNFGWVGNTVQDDCNSDFWISESEYQCCQLVYPFHRTLFFSADRLQKTRRITDSTGQKKQVTNGSSGLLAARGFHGPRTWNKGKKMVNIIEWHKKKSVYYRNDSQPRRILAVSKFETRSHNLSVNDFWLIFSNSEFHAKIRITGWIYTKTTAQRMRPVVLTHLPNFCPVYRTSGNTAEYPRARGDTGETIYINGWDHGETPRGETPDHQTRILIMKVSAWVLWPNNTLVELPSL
jgi:hypothetical protein